MVTERFPTDYMKLKDRLTFLTAEDLLTFELKAKVLSFEDVCTYLCILPAEIPECELPYAQKAHARGQVDAIHTAAGALFSNMKTRNGAVAALEYLKATSGLFQIDATPISPGSGGGFSFHVNMTQDGQEAPATGSDAPGTDKDKPTLAEVKKIDA
jgi:hypothetical protein